MPHDMIPADPEFRKKVIRLVLLTGVVMFVLIAVGFPIINQQLLESDPVSAIRWLKTAMLILLAIPIVFAAYFLGLGIRIIRERQFPPEGTRVIKDTPLLLGNEAKRRGIIIIILAAILIDLSITAIIFAFSFLNSLL